MGEQARSINNLYAPYKLQKKNRFTVEIDVFRNSSALEIDRVKIR